MKLSEIYTSVQGEGPNTGKPIQFLRLAGCNMRCPGWPCDTPQAIFPDQYRHEWEDVTIETIISRLDEYPRHVCLTGGEPFLQKDTEDLISNLRLAGFAIDIFTNGSFVFPNTVTFAGSVTTIMDWKLIGSGEADTALDVRRENVKRLATPGTRNGNVKFVVKDTGDLHEAWGVWHGLCMDKLVRERIQFWVGAAWGRIEDKTIVDFILEKELPWRLNIQTHKHVWEPEARYT